MFSAGAMGPKGCSKCTKFIVTCDSFHIPLIFLHDTPGFFVGKNAEHAGVAGQIINFYEALAHATVPKIAIVVRKSYGMAYYNVGGGNMNRSEEHTSELQSLMSLSYAVICLNKTKQDNHTY